MKLYLLCVLLVGATYANDDLVEDLEKRSSPPVVCRGKADILFVVDSSGSVGASNYVKEKNFVKEIVRRLDIGNDHVHVGFIRFSTSASMQFGLKKFTTKSTVLAAVDRVGYTAGWTFTNKALAIARTLIAREGRAGVPKIVVIITDGLSTSRAATKTEITKVHAAGIKTIAVGIGSSISGSTELTSLASKPTSSHKFTVSNFLQLGSTLIQNLVKTTCTAITLQPIITVVSGDVYDKTHISGGTKKSQYTTEKACFNACTGLCRGADFDTKSGAGCYFHYAKTECNAMRDLATCTHFRRVKCAVCPAPTGKRSPGTRTAVTLQVTNQLKEPVQMYWINFAGGLSPYAKINPGATFTQKTWAGHLWTAKVVSDASYVKIGGSCIYTTPSSGSHHIYITDGTTTTTTTTVITSGGCNKG